jgi:hypothetical protein
MHAAHQTVNAVRYWWCIGAAGYCRWVTAAVFALTRQIARPMTRGALLFI